MYVPLSVINSILYFQHNVFVCVCVLCMCIFKMYVHVSLSVINSCKLRILAACLPPIIALSDCQHCLVVIVYILCVYIVKMET